MIRVLLDENVPNKLRQALTEFDPATAQLMGFAGLRNGELLDAAEAAGFTVLLTGDKSMEYEQRIPGRKIAVVALGSALAYHQTSSGEDQGCNWRGRSRGKVTRVDACFCPKAAETGGSVIGMISEANA